MTVDVAMSDDNVCNRTMAISSDPGGVDADVNTADDSCLLLDFLPRDILTQSILTNFLDGNSLANFWCATMSKREIVIRRNSPRCSLPSPSSSMPPLTMVEEIFQIIRRRRTLLTEEDDNDKLDSTNDNQRYCLRRQVFQAFEDAISKQSTVDDTDSDDSSQEQKSDKIDNVEINGVSHNQLVHNNDSSFDFGEFLRFSSRIFGNLMALEYCENVPHNLIWCGYLRISHSQLAGMNYSEPIKVALVVHPRRWSMKEIRLWRNATTFSMSNSAHEEECLNPPTVKATVIPHNFLAVGPNRGRLVGLTETGRRFLHELADGMNRSGQVARFSCSTVSSIPSSATADRGRQFTVKLVAFDQAERKLGTVFRRGYEPGGIPLGVEKESMVLHSIGGANCDSNSSYAGINHDSNSLLCCWNHEFLWEDSKSFRMETTHAMRDTMNEFNRLRQ